MIDKAVEIARLPDVILCSFGDMLRVPGSDADLLRVKSIEGGDVRIVYSPLVAVTAKVPDRRDHRARQCDGGLREGGSAISP